VRAGNWTFRTRDALFPIVLLALAFGTRPRIAAGSMRCDHLVDAAGVLVSLIGQVLRVLVIGLVYITRGGQNRQVWANSLVDGGVFRHSRNPLYLANLLLVLGLAIVHNGWAMYLIALPFFFVAYSCVVMAEEHYLLGRFGDSYTSYCERVPRWIPVFRGFSATLTGTSFDGLKVLRKEYGTPVAWVSGVLLLLIWEHSAPGATPIGDRELSGIVTFWVGLLIAYVTVRTLKLRGRLGIG